MNDKNKKEDIENLISEINSNSPYQRKSVGTKKWMTVLEMGNLLGLKKTE